MSKTFKTLAEDRVNRALKTINQIGDLGNKTKYFYTEQDVEKIVGALEEAVRKMQDKLETALKMELKAVKFVLSDENTN